MWSRKKRKEPGRVKQEKEAEQTLSDRERKGVARESKRVARWLERERMKGRKALVRGVG